VIESLMHSPAWYRMYFLTPYTLHMIRCWRLRLQPHVSTGVCRVPESLMHSTAWYRMCFLTPYTLHLRMSDVTLHTTCMNALWRTYDCVMSSIRMRHATPMNASRCTYE